MKRKIILISSLILTFGFYTFSQSDSSMAFRNKTNKIKNNSIKSITTYLKSLQDQDSQIQENKNELIKPESISFEQKKNELIKKSKIKTSEPINITIDDGEYPPAPQEIQDKIDSQIKVAKEEYKEVQLDASAVVLCEPKNISTCINQSKDKTCATQRSNCKNLYQYKSVSSSELSQVIGVKNNEKLNIHQETLKEIGSTQGNIQFNK